MPRRIEGFSCDPHILWSSEPGEAGPSVEEPPAPGIWVTVSRSSVQVTAAPRGWWVHLSFHCLIFLGVSSVCQTLKVPKRGASSSTGHHVDGMKAAVLLHPGDAKTRSRNTRKDSNLFVIWIITEFLLQKRWAY